MINPVQGWSIILHGGAKDIPACEEDEHRNGLRKALACGVDLLRSGAGAIATVAGVVAKLEDLPIFNAGTGAAKNEAGEVEMDASIMDGATLDIGSVAGLRDVLNPVAVARSLLREKTVLLVGEGALQYARAKGFKAGRDIECGSKSPGSDTVGCVVRDVHGDLAVATSTGGLEGAKVGRVGDVPMPGCGFYADNRRGAVSLSGDGESIARTLLAAAVLERFPRTSPQCAVEEALQTIHRVGGAAGAIFVAPDGQIAWFHNSPDFAVALAHQAAPEGQIFLRKVEAV